MNRDTLVAKLKDDLADGRVVTIVGTGVSVAACGNQEIEGCKVATWPGLLRHGVKHCQDISAADDGDVELLTMQIASGKTNFLISAAEDISQRLQAKGSGRFLGWLKDTVGQLKVKDRAVLDALAALPGVLATLNYDNLLEDATARRAVTWQKADEVQDVLTRIVEDAVLHLHGWFREPDSVVLGLSSYLAVKDHPHAKAVLNLFTLDRTLLFVGCGDTVLDPNFTRLIEWGKEALREVSPRHYLLCRTSEIADFQKKLAGAPWLQPLSYGAEYKDLVPFLRSLVPPVGAATPAKPLASTGPGFDLAAYQQAMRKRYARLKLEELDPTTHDARPLTLTGMFIAQSARECAEFLPRVFELPKELQRRLRDSGEMAEAEMDEEMLKEHRRAYLDQSPRPILDIVGDPACDRLVVLGDPGSGKSTLLQYLLVQWAEKARPDPAADPLPLLIELREYARLRHEGKADGFLGYLHDCPNVRWHFDQARLDGWLRENASLVLFDGLDEIFDPVLRAEISTAIHRFADTYPRARIVVTSRIIGYQHEKWRDEKFHHFMLQELDDAQIADFLARWHRGAYEEPAQGEAKRALLARAIEDSAAIRQLAGNPLLITMMAILNRTQDLPRDRAELYEQCARLLLHQWKVDVAFSSYPELANASLDYKDKRGLLLRVARAMQTSEGGLAGNLIGEETLERTLADGLKGVPNLRPDRAARALIEQLRGRNFMLSSVGGRSYAFVHRTFLEYFCAVEIRERFQAERMLTLDQIKTEVFGHWADETWHEVLCLLAGMLAPKFVAEILEWLLARPEPGAGYSIEAFHRVFLAARCYAEVRRQDEVANIGEQILARLMGLIGKIPAGAGLFSEDRVWAENQKCQGEPIRLISRIWPPSETIRIWLKIVADSSPDPEATGAAVHAIAVGWKGDPKTVEWLKDQTQAGESCWLRQSAVQEMALGWKDDPETLPILKARAQSDENKYVRETAVQKLARGWKDDSETLSILKVLVQSDEDTCVRRSAVQELSRGWKDAPGILPILKTCAQSDADTVVRYSAVEELARGWRDDPKTLRWLKALAQSDTDKNVRQTAMQELARGWKDDPDVQTFLARLKEEAPAKPED